jgi:hypothetical protein
MAVGVFVLVAGLSTGEAASDLAGIVFIALGLFLYRLLFRFTRRLEREISEVQKG